MHKEAIVWAVKLAALIVTGIVSGYAQSPYYEVKKFVADNTFTTGVEGPTVDAKGNLYAVNFQRNGTIGMVTSTGIASLFVELPEGSTANAIVFDANGDMLLADYTGHNILKVSVQTKTVSVFSHNDAFNQPNDLAINSKGQLFASDPNWKESTGKLWRIDPDGKSVLLGDAMGTTNGIALSPDEKTLYVNESAQRKIWAFTVDDTGAVSGKKLFFEFPDFGLDGMKCDRKGNLYVTRHGKGTVAIISPKGKLLREVKMLGTKPSNIIFGGIDGKVCFVTQQDNGSIEIFRSKIAGAKF